jgi:hypothetical protein
LVQVSFKFKVSRRNYVKFYQIPNLEASVNFYSKSLSNMKTFLWRKLFLSSRPSQHILFKKFRAQEGPFWTGQSSIEFEDNSNSFEI